MAFQQVDKIFLLGLAHVGHAIGDQHDAGGTVCVQGFQGQAQAAEQVGAATGLQLHDFLRVATNAIRGGIHEAISEFFGAVIKQHDTETVSAAQFAQGLADAVGQGGKFGIHGTGDIQHEHPVAAGGDWRQVVTGGDAEHEGAAVFPRGLVGNQIHAAGQVLLVAPVDDDVLIQGKGIGRLAIGSGRGEVGALAVVVFFADNGCGAIIQFYLPVLRAQLLDLCLGMLWQAQGVHRVAAAQVEGETEMFLDTVVGGPERQLLFVHPAFFQRVHIATDAGIHKGRLHVDQPHPGVLAGAYRLHPHIEGLVAVLLGESGFAASGFFLFIDLAGLLFFQHLADYRLAVDPHRELGHGAALRDREAVVGFQVLVIGIVKNLLHLGDGVAVFHVHGDMLFANLQWWQAAVGWRHQPRGQGRGGQHAAQQQCQAGKQSGQSVPETHDGSPCYGSWDSLYRWRGHLLNSVH